jgi:hypothetical protein
VERREPARPKLGNADALQPLPRDRFDLMDTILA